MSQITSKPTAMSNLERRLARMDILQEAEARETTFEMAWIIKGFPDLMEKFKPGDAVTSDEFSFRIPFKNTLTTWSLQCYPKDFQKSQSAGFILRLFSLSNVVIQGATIIIGLLDKDGAELKLSETTQAMQNNSALQASTPNSTLTTSADRLMPEGYLTIFVRIMLPISPMTVCNRDVVVGGADAEKDQEQEDILNKMVVGSFVDLSEASVVLVFADGEQRCHTFPLAARSSVFREMVTDDLLDLKSGRLEFTTQVKLATGLDLLFYLYNGRLRVNSDLVGLLTLADQYDMTELKAWCAESLAKSVSAANYLPLLRLADQHDLPRLKAAVIKYIAGNANSLTSA